MRYLKCVAHTQIIIQPKIQFHLSLLLLLSEYKSAAQSYYLVFNPESFNFGNFICLKSSFFIVTQRSYTFKIFYPLGEENGTFYLFVGFETFTGATFYFFLFDDRQQRKYLLMNPFYLLPSDETYNLKDLVYFVYLVSFVYLFQVDILIHKYFQQNLRNNILAKFQIKYLQSYRIMNKIKLLETFRFYNNGRNYNLQKFRTNFNLEINQSFLIIQQKNLQVQMRQKNDQIVNKMNFKIKEKENQVSKFIQKVNLQIDHLKLTQRQKNPKYWGINSFQRKIQNQSQISNKYSKQNTNEPFLQQEPNKSSPKIPWDYHKSKDLIHVNLCDPIKYYPPSCSGYDITYCKLQNSIYIYGGISCQTILDEGIKPYFFKYKQQKWTEVKHESIYCPLPRYGHTLCCFQRDLVLFGGVSQYKEKLKDRCFYSDLSIFNTQKNQWKILQTSGNFAKTRKNHAMCIFGKYLFIYGGINQNQQVIPDLSWINLQQKKPRWRSMNFQPRFNHKVISLQTKGKQYLVVFGGRNQQSQIINTLSLIPIYSLQGQIQLKDPIKLSHQMSCRQMPLMQRFSQGFIILGGTNQDNEVVCDSWYFHSQKQTFQKLQFSLDFKQLRGCQGVSMSLQKVYILSSNSKKYKAIQIQLQK